MAVKFTQQFTSADIRRFIEKKILIVEDIIKDQLIDIGEEFVRNARSVNTYTDRTRNLRGSIGYVVLKDKVAVFGNFDGVSTGQFRAKRLVVTIRSEHPRGFVLIVVAGMNYAVYVEAKGYDVLTGSSQIADRETKQQFDRLAEQLKKVKS